LGANVRANNCKIDIADLYREYSDVLYRFIAKRLPRNDAADLMQDAFVRVLCLADGYELHSPQPFLFRVVNNLIIDYHKATRSNAYNVCESVNSVQQSADNPTPETLVYAQQRLNVMRQAIEELPPRCKQVFLLHKFEHQSHAAVAKRLGISINMVEKHIIRALAHCRQRLADLD
jgi:RNA polymerase sigma-70 factor (ECF subfamily)